MKVLTWYDNEWGYTSQLVREARRFARAREKATEYVAERGD